MIKIIINPYNDLSEIGIFNIKFSKVWLSKYSKILDGFIIGIQKGNGSASTGLLLALALSIDNLIVEIDSYELPAMDGSAYEYTYKISEVGKKSQNKPKKFLKING